MSEDDGVASGSGPDDLEEVQRRVAEIQRRKRGRIRWSIGRHTAEMAIDVLHAERPLGSKRNGKQRRRKRHKRLL